MKHITLFIFAFLIHSSCTPQRTKDSTFNSKINEKYTIHTTFNKYFEDCGVDGTVVIFDKNNEQWILSDTIISCKEYLPASTFKIINLLIALETKIIKDENEIIKWPGQTDTVKYGYRPEIYHNMTVKEAFEVSAGWVFIELAKKIGKANYKKYLSACKYGNLDLSESNDDFWNFGGFAISPINQADFIKKLYEQDLPFSKHNMDIVKKIMIVEQNEQYTIGAKTGWTRENNTNTGWWLGYLESKGNVYYFATLLLQDRKNNRSDFGPCRKQIAKKVFESLGIIDGDNEKLYDGNQLINAIDHVPIVVSNLEEVKQLLKNELHFTVKDGKAHEGIHNCFVKFEDDTYLEFIEPIDSTQDIGRFYANFFKERQGGTSFAVSISNTSLLKRMLFEKNIKFSYDSNRVWQTIEPQKSDMFFIEYVDKSWKESPKNTTHINESTALEAIYLFTDGIDDVVKKYKDLGFHEIGQGSYIETPYRLLGIGKSKLYILDTSKAMKINKMLHSSNLKGICGYKIKVKSIDAINKIIKQGDKIHLEANTTTVFLKKYNVFLTFAE
jgi:beta-lactamase class D